MYLWIRKFNVKISVLPKANYMFSVFAAKIPMIFLAEIDKSILIFIKNFKGYQITKTTLTKNKFGGLTLQDFFSFIFAQAGIFSVMLNISDKSRYLLYP